MNTDENAASVKEEVKHDAVMKVEAGAVKAEEATTPAANGAHGEPAIGSSQPVAAVTGTKRKAEDAAGGHERDGDSTAAAGGAADTKPKPSPARQSPLEKAAAAKGQKTMSSFFSKKETGAREK